MRLVAARIPVENVVRRILFLALLLALLGGLWLSYGEWLLARLGHGR
jgi:hypothetical protein